MRAVTALTLVCVLLAHGRKVDGDAQGTTSTDSSRETSTQTPSCKTKRPDFHVLDVTARSVKVQLTHTTLPEGWRMCACAINSLVATKMKEIVCSKQRTPGPPCQSSNETQILMSGLTADTNYTVCVRYQCPGSDVSPVFCDNLKTVHADAGPAVPTGAVREVVASGVTSSEANVTWTAEGTSGDFEVTLWKIKTHREQEHIPVTTKFVRDTGFHFKELSPWTAYRVEVSGNTNHGTVGNSTVFRTQPAENKTIDDLTREEVRRRIRLSRLRAIRLHRQYQQQARDHFSEMRETEWHAYPISSFIQPLRNQQKEPTMPQGLRLTNLTSTTLSLAWDAPKESSGPLSGYTVFYGPSQEHRKRSSLTTNQTSVTVTHLTPNTEFEVYVKAFNKLSNGSEVASQAVRLVATTGIGAPTKVQNLRAVGWSKNSIVVEWSPPLKSNGPLDGYVVYYCNRSEQTKTMVPVTNHSECHSLHPGKVTRVTVNFLSPESKYAIAVSAYNLLADRHNRLDSNPEIINVDTLPDAPTALADIDVNILSPQSVEVNWEPPSSGAAGYVVAWCQDHRCSEESIEGTRTIIHGLHSDTDYNVSVVPYKTNTAGAKITGPLTTKLVTVKDPSLGSAAVSRYLVGTIVCSVIISLMGGFIFLMCRKKKGTGPQLYKRMSSLENDDDDIVFMKSVPRRTQQPPI